MSLGKPIVTLFEAYGAGAHDVGPLLAGRLGVPWIQQGQSSERLEALDPKGTGHIDVGRFLTSVAFADQGSIELIGSPNEVIARRNALDVTAAVADGGVILGRNATVILGRTPGALHVKLDAPVAVRVERAAAQAGVPVAQASVRQRREDEARAVMSLDLWGWDPRLTDHYDLLVNTDTFTVVETVEMILDALERKRAGATAT
jgi:hypothetical protein